MSLYQKSYQLCYHRKEKEVRTTCFREKQARFSPSKPAHQVCPSLPELFCPQHPTRHHDLQHPTSLSGPVPEVPGQGQVTCRSRRQVQLRGDSVRMVHRRDVDLACRYPSVAPDPPCPDLSEDSRYMRISDYFSCLLCLHGGKPHHFLCAASPPPLRPAASWSPSTLIYVFISMCVATGFFAIYWAVISCQRLALCPFLMWRFWLSITTLFERTGR